MSDDRYDNRYDSRYNNRYDNNRDNRDDRPFNMHDRPNDHLRNSGSPGGSRLDNANPYQGGYASYGGGPRFSEDSFRSAEAGRIDRSEHGFSSDRGDYRIRHDVPTTHRHGQADHTGRGPKNWMRSDENIRDTVCHELTLHPEIDASEMEVTVNQGVVTLQGHVEHRQIKRMAESEIENLPGVKDVRNELVVDQSLFARAREAFMSMIDPSGTISQSVAGRVSPKK